jgi:hypothetical protein
MEANIIKQILLEWSVESDDGLLSGYNSDSNISCLKSILTRRNVSETICQEIISELLATENQPRVRKLSAKQIAKAERDAAEKARISGIDPYTLSSESLTDIKLIREKIPEILAMAEQFPAIKDNYNKLSLEQAIEFSNDPSNQQAIQKLAELKGMTLGEGELLIVFLTKDAKSGGTKSGDIDVDGKNIDVKKIDAWKFRVELASFDRFNATEFGRAINELIQFASNAKNAEVLKKLVDSADDKIIAKTTGKSAQFKETTKRFLSTPDIELFRRGAVMGLLGVGANLENKEATSPASDHADFVINHDTTTLKVDNSKEIESQLKQQSVKSPESQPQDVVVKVSPIDDEEAQLIMPKVKRLKYFSDRFGPVNIAKSVLPALHYDAIIFYDPKTKNGTGKLFRIMTKEEVVNNFEFYGWAKAPEFSLLSRPGNSYASDETENTPIA